MRWQRLFDDLEGQAAAELESERDQLELEESRLRIARLGLRDRLMVLAEPGQTGAIAAVRLELLGGATVLVEPVTFGKDWLAGRLIDGSPWHPQCVVPLAAIASVILDRAQVDPSLEVVARAEGGLIDRLGISFVLRDLSRRRSSVEILGANGTVHGTIDRVGRDHLDLAVHEPGTPRRERAVRQYRMVPFEQLRLIRLVG